MSQITLDIYRRNPDTKRREYDRTVATETAFIPFGPVQDILEALDIEVIIAMMNDEEVGDTTALIATMGPAIIGAMKEITPILLDTFEDVTEDEIRMCNTADICRVVLDILTLAVTTAFAKSKKKTKGKKTIGQ